MHDEPCHACGKPCDALASDPSLWPTMLPAEQSARPFHMGCAAQIMCDAERYRRLRDHRGAVDDIGDPAPAREKERPND